MSTVKTYQTEDNYLATCGGALYVPQVSVVVALTITDSNGNVVSRMEKTNDNFLSNALKLFLAVVGGHSGLSGVTTAGATTSLPTTFATAPTTSIVIGSGTQTLSATISNLVSTYTSFAALISSLAVVNTTSTQVILSGSISVTSAVTISEVGLLAVTPVGAFLLTYDTFAGQSTGTSGGTITVTITITFS